MNDIVSGIDHTLIIVRDLSASEAAYRRLGFSPTERGHHPLLGTGNHLFMFDGEDYLELLGIERPTASNERWRRVLAEREGPAGVALKTRDVAATVVALAARGLPGAQVAQYARPVRLPEGNSEARFASAYVPEAGTPGAAMFFCQHLTPEVVWRKEWQSHANGAIGMAGVLGLSSDPVATAAGYAALVGDHNIRGATVMLGPRPLEFVRPSDTAWSGGIAPASGTTLPRLAGFAVRVADLAATARYLESAKVPYARAGSGIVVAPSHASGTVLKFVA